MTAAANKKPARRSRTAWVMALPLVLFAGLAALFFAGLNRGDPSKLPSVLIGKPVPQFDLPPLTGLVRDGAAVAGLSSKDLAGGTVHIVNFWASWCGPCRDEHPFLVQLSKTQGATLVGINYKDETAGARRFLGRFGNPFAAVGVDAKGAAAIEWGVSGMPETFVVGRNGTILYKHVGPINAKTLQTQVLPALAKAQGKG